MIFWRGCYVSDMERVFERNVLSLILEMHVTRFHLFMKWEQNDKQLTWEEIRYIAGYYARNIEHGLNGIHKLVEIYLDNDILSDANLMMLR